MNNWKDHTYVDKPIALKIVIAGMLVHVGYTTLTGVLKYMRVPWCYVQLYMYRWIDPSIVSRSGLSLNSNCSHALIVVCSSILIPHAITLRYATYNKTLTSLWLSVKTPKPLKKRDFVTQRSWLDLGSEYFIINHSVNHTVSERPESAASSMFCPWVWLTLRVERVIDGYLNSPMHYVDFPSVHVRCL